MFWFGLGVHRTWLSQIPDLRGVISLLQTVPSQLKAEIPIPLQAPLLSEPNLAGFCSSWAWPTSAWWSSFCGCDRCVSLILRLPASAGVISTFFPGGSVPEELGLQMLLFCVTVAELQKKEEVVLT